jgi:acyl-CoA synthetase (AMP-forming)/AMP-acid ligase II
VVLRSPGALDVAGVKEFAGATLAGFKVPTYVEFLDVLPHNASGKVLKHLLGQPAAASGFIEEAEA